MNARLRGNRELSFENRLAIATPVMRRARLRTWTRGGQRRSLESLLQEG
jgi:hypothetical protein